MSTELNVSPVMREANVSLTQFWGGESRGVCLQVTTPDGFVQFTSEEALAVAQALNDWALHRGAVPTGFVSDNAWSE